MKLMAIRNPERPLSWDDVEFAGLHSASDTLDDRINENLPNADDEVRVSVDVILHRIIHGGR